MSLQTNFVKWLTSTRARQDAVNKSLEELPKPDLRLFGMEDAELKRTFAPKTLQWRLTKLAETVVDIAFWWRPKK